MKTVTVKLSESGLVDFCDPDGDFNDSTIQALFDAYVDALFEKVQEFWPTASVSVTVLPILNDEFTFDPVDWDGEATADLIDILAEVANSDWADKVVFC